MKYLPALSKNLEDIFRTSRHAKEYDLQTSYVTEMYKNNFVQWSKYSIRLRNKKFILKEGSKYFKTAGDRL